MAIFLPLGFIIGPAELRTKLVGVAWLCDAAWSTSRQTDGWAVMWRRDAAVHVL
jgi:hypothetical protein